MVNVVGMTPKCMERCTEPKSQGCCAQRNAESKFVASAQIKLRRDSKSVQPNASPNERGTPKKVGPDIHRFHMKATPEPKGSFVRMSRHWMSRDDEVVVLEPCRNVVFGS